MIKQAIENYYNKLDMMWINRRSTHPMVPYIDKMPMVMYSGDKTNSDYVEWELVENSQKIDFEEIANVIGMKLHTDLMEYFTSYYFLKMVGELNGVKVTFTPITPLVHIPTFLIERYKISKEQSRDEKKIELGFAEVNSADCYLLLFDNETGKVEIFDPEKNITRVVADSLYNLISDMEPRC